MHGRKRQAPSAAATAVAVDASLGDHDETARVAARHAPGPVEVATEAPSDPLHQHPHRLAGDFDEALDPQDVVRARRRDQAIDQRVGIADGRNRDDESVEIVVIVLAFGVVMRRARGEIVLGRRADAEQDIGVDRALARGAILTARGKAPAICA